MAPARTDGSVNVFAVYLTTDPAWPWSLPQVGVSALLGIVLALAAFTVWSYVGQRQ